VLGVVENMSGFACPCCGTSSDIFKASGEGPRGMAARFGVPFLGALPIDPQLLACCEKGEAYVVKHAGSPGAAAFLGVVAALRGGIEGGSAGGPGAGAGEGGGGS
jgi:ATP-binding protein involved in chromosome partitioning